MMDHEMDRWDRASGRIAGDFKTLIDDGEDLLQAAVAVSGEGFAVARKQFEDRLKSAKALLAEASQPMLDRTRATGALADDYVRSHPWSAVGVAVAAGVMIGLLAAKR